MCMVHSYLGFLLSKLCAVILTLVSLKIFHTVICCSMGFNKTHTNFFRQLVLSLYIRFGYRIINLTWWRWTFDITNSLWLMSILLYLYVYIIYHYISICLFYIDVNQYNFGGVSVHISVSQMFYHCWRNVMSHTWRKNMTSHWLIEAERRIYESVNSPSLVQMITCRLVDTKPLCESTLEYC